MKLTVGIWLIDGEFYLDRKFYGGMLVYCKYWKGDVRLIIRQTNQEPPVFGLVKLNSADLQFDIILIEENEILIKKNLIGADVILASGDNYKNLHLPLLCKQLNIKLIYNIEYILETRFQILSLTNLSPWKKAKSLLWHLIIERKRRKAFSLSDGFQANGYPAYNAYKKIHI